MQSGTNSHEHDGGVFVMRCWVTPDGKVAGRVQWSTLAGERGTSAVGGLSALASEVHAFLDLVSRVHRPDGEN